ncbi:hypothetical protein [Rhodococcus sp. BH5]|uniref:hypothetical protein n=1 Tax=Rhodococcus sp. BH5 TaxID=2871702 RepID=UPI0022CD8556|nr:hypothetical protein [Rhodococcus sp. BH5]MCZ9635273.1 hypothetical protein [Rhodococcus sp. BH5]
MVVSNNLRNRKLDGVLAVRATTTPKPGIPTVVPFTADDPLVGSILADDITQIFHDEIANGRPDGPPLSRNRAQTQQSTRDRTRIALRTSPYNYGHTAEGQRQLGQQSTVSRDNEINPFVSASLNEASRSTRLVVSTARWVQRAQPWGAGRTMGSGSGQ